MCILLYSNGMMRANVNRSISGRFLFYLALFIEYSCSILFIIVSFIRKKKKSFLLISIMYYYSYLSVYKSVSFYRMKL